jgi:UDP-glucose 4-epimerase
VSKRILITGATGFIGANLARRALLDGHEVHLLHRPSYQKWRLEEIAADVRLHPADLDNADQVRAAVRVIRPEWIFHLAAYGAYSTQRGLEQMTKTNLLGCASLLEACGEAGFDAFVNCGSSSEYGLKNHAALESEAIAPNSHYAITKAAATHYCELYARTHPGQVFNLRLYSIYGSYEEPSRLIPTLLMYGLHQKLPPLVNPRTARDFVFVEDAVDAIVTVAARASALSSGIYNVCTGSQTSLRELVDIVRSLMDISAEPVWGSMEQRSWDTDIWVGSAEKLYEHTGWRAQTSLKEGLSLTLNWFQQNPVWLTFYKDRICPADP